MLFFDLTKVEKEAKYEPRNIFKVLKDHSDRPNKSLMGQSYLINPYDLIVSKQDILYKLQYLRLAARRDYALYKHYMYKALDLSYYPEVDKSLIIPNPLLILNNNTIKFIFDEQNKKEIKWH